MKLIWIWFQEWNGQGNCTGYGGERDFKTKKELQKWLNNYVPNFENCTLHQDYIEEKDKVDIEITNENVVNATQRRNKIIGE